MSEILYLSSSNSSNNNNNNSDSVSQQELFLAKLSGGQNANSDHRKVTQQLDRAHRSPQQQTQIGKSSDKSRGNQLRSVTGLSTSNTSNYQRNFNQHHYSSVSQLATSPIVSNMGDLEQQQQQHLSKSASTIVNLTASASANVVRSQQPIDRSDSTSLPSSTTSTSESMFQRRLGWVQVGLRLAQLYLNETFSAIFRPQDSRENA